MYENFRGSTFLSTISIVRLLNFSHFMGCMVLPHCGFKLHFPNNNDVDYLFQMLVCHYIFSLVNYLFKSSTYFIVDLLVLFIYSWCIWILQSDCPFQQSVSWDFYWDHIVSVCQFWDNLHLHNIAFSSMNMGYSSFIWASFNFCQQYIFLNFTYFARFISSCYIL